MSCKNQSDRICSFRIHLRWRCSRTRPDTRYNSFRRRCPCSYNRPTLDRTLRFRQAFRWFHAGSKNRRHRIHEARHRGLRSDRASTGRNVVRQCCGCTSSTRRSCGCSFRQHLGQCFRYSRRAGKAEPFQTRRSGRRSSRPSRSRNEGLWKQGTVLKIIYRMNSA